MNTRLVEALRSRDVRVITVLDGGLSGRSDEDQLKAATELKCAVFTFNVPDFVRIHQRWQSAGRSHGGLILAQQQRFSIGEQLRRILRLRGKVSAEEMQDRMEFLSNWG